MPVKVDKVIKNYDVDWEPEVSNQYIIYLVFNSNSKEISLATHPIEVAEKFQTGDVVIKFCGGLSLVTDYEIEGVVNINKGLIFGEAEE